jgi:hypothetical protein
MEAWQSGMAVHFPGRAGSSGAVFAIEIQVCSGVRTRRAGPVFFDDLPWRAQRGCQSAVARHCSNSWRSSSVVPQPRRGLRHFPQFLWFLIANDAPRPGVIDVGWLAPKAVVLMPQPQRQPTQLASLICVQARKPCMPGICVKLCATRLWTMMRPLRGARVGGTRKIKRSPSIIVPPSPRRLTRLK